MVKSHLEISLRDNRVASFQNSLRLRDALKDNSDGGKALANPPSLQQCDHDKMTKGDCKGKFRPPQSGELVLNVPIAK